MPITYRIYPKQRLVFATGRGTLSAPDFFAYQRSVWADPAVAGFDELVDMGEVTSIELPSTESVRELANLSASMDESGTSSKFAIVALDNLSFGLGQMYGARREMNPMSTKQVQVFGTKREALEWLGIEASELENESVGG